MSLDVRVAKCAEEIFHARVSPHDDDDEMASWQCEILKNLQVPDYEPTEPKYMNLKELKTFVKREGKEFIEKIEGKAYLAKCGPCWAFSPNDWDAARPSPWTSSTLSCSPSLKSHDAPAGHVQADFGGNLCPLTVGQAALSFQEQSDFIRAQCRAERLQNSEQPTVLMHERPINEIHSDGKIFEQGWQKVSVAVDSGAAETVIPHTLVMGHPIMETDASRNGVNYASATGQPIPNLGEQRLPLCTVEGSLRSMTFQAAPVSRALGSVKRMISSGHRVVFDEDGSFVQNKQSGEINWLREENGNFMMDMWIMPIEVLDKMRKQGFGRQP